MDLVIEWIQWLTGTAPGLIILTSCIIVAVTIWTVIATIASGQKNSAKAGGLRVDADNDNSTETSVGIDFTDGSQTIGIGNGLHIDTDGDGVSYQPWRK